MKILLASTATTTKIEIPATTKDLAKVDDIQLPFFEISTLVLSICLAIGTLVKTSTAKLIATREAEKELISNLRQEIEDKDEEIETLKRRIYRLENRLRMADIELSAPLSTPQGVYNNGNSFQNNSSNY